MLPIASSESSNSSESMLTYDSARRGIRRSRTATCSATDREPEHLKVVDRRRLVPLFVAEVDGDVEVGVWRSMVSGSNTRSGPAPRPRGRGEEDGEGRCGEAIPAHAAMLPEQQLVRRWDCQLTRLTSGPCVRTLSACSSPGDWVPSWDSPSISSSASCSCSASCSWPTAADGRVRRQPRVRFGAAPRARARGRRAQARRPRHGDRARLPRGAARMVDMPRRRTTRSRSPRPVPPSRSRSQARASASARCSTSRWSPRSAGSTSCSPAST